jgi:hypothetical protein
VSGQAAAEQVPVTANLALADTTLLGMDEEPGWVRGYGPVPAEVARHVIATADETGPATLRRLYADPATGRLTKSESSASAFPPSLADLIGLRDQDRCRNAWCDGPVLDRDHVKSRGEGGETSLDNGQCLCEACNIAKEAPGWSARPRPGPAGQHTIETVTPTGHVYLSHAPQVRVVRRPLTVELYLTDDYRVA